MTENASTSEINEDTSKLIHYLSRRITIPFKVDYAGKKRWLEEVRKGVYPGKGIDLKIASFEQKVSRIQMQRAVSFTNDLKNIIEKQKSIEIPNFLRQTFLDASRDRISNRLTSLWDLEGKEISGNGTGIIKTGKITEIFLGNQVALEMDFKESLLPISFTLLPTTKIDQ
ncbi:hypothetical protein BH10PAT1_BH10PAT1_0650 [soil metagenome]